MTNDDTANAAAKPTRKMAREPKADLVSASSPKRTSKSAAVLAMLLSPEGATLNQLAIATGWLPHTARAALTGLRKKGHEVISDKPAGGVRTYRVTAGAETAQ